MKQTRIYPWLKQLAPACGLVFVMLLLLVPMAYAQLDADVPTFLPTDSTDIEGGGDCTGLADMIRTGNIHLWNLKCFLAFFAQGLVTLAVSISLIFVMYGGYYMILTPEGDTTKGRQIITRALKGLAVSLLAWIIVSLVLQLVTE